MARLKIAEAARLIVSTTILFACTNSAAFSYFVDRQQRAADRLFGAGLLCIVVIISISILSLLYKLTHNLAVVGVGVGLIIGLCIVISVPLELQYAVIGGLLGIGADFLASSSKLGAPATIIESLSNIIIKTTQSAKQIGSVTELEHDAKRVSQLLWSTVGTIALMLLLGRSLGAVLWPGVLENSN